MATFGIHKVTALPGTLAANSIYVVAAGANKAELYVTGTNPTTVRRLLTEADVQAMITAATSGAAALQIVDTIAARNALTPVNGMTALVINATGDTSVASGSATYVYRSSTTAWIKIAEFESMDLVVTWAQITGKPTSAVADIDDAVSKRHAHTNLTQLGKVSEDGAGDFTYGGNHPRARLDTADW